MAFDRVAVRRNSEQLAPIGNHSCLVSTANINRSRGNHEAADSCEGSRKLLPYCKHATSKHKSPEIPVYQSLRGMKGNSREYM